MKRATCIFTANGACKAHFNPRPREEGDRGRLSVENQYKDFNPRPREEGDDTENGPKSIGIYFNPRPREEGD